ncbi:Cytoplasmic tRNA 2-thiolation protein 2 [Dillenia turbinata]|uniref:Cytoplasmic tRNA 2-thiolation protein 2 n=1 Tax=Dillenia turbinata TaxID=194707 RepID=A0AAN8WAZ3_9MAGN
MACNGSGGCQSGGCFNETKSDAATAGREGINKQMKKGINDRSICLKCKINKASAGCGSDEGQFCSDCFRNNLYGKFKLAVTSRSMISPIDNVLVAFSGGTSSRTALQFVHEMQCKAQKNFDASRDRSLPVFGVGVAFIDDSSISSLPSNEVEKAIEDMRLIVSSLGPPKKVFHVAPIENVCSSDSDDGRLRLQELLDDVSDVTGKEDLLLHLRMLSLQKIALENGYNRLVLGSSASRIACHVLSSTIKGRGYSLPADIQYIDARREVPVVLPLRDCLKQELSMFCHLEGLKTIEVLKSSHSGINSLVSSFVKLLQEENPSRERTILRTAEKLTPFQFNKIPESEDCKVSMESRRRQKKYNVKNKGSIPSESLCPICSSPLDQSELKGLGSSGNCQTSIDVFGAACCSSCQFQILPKDPSSMEHFHSLLPQPMTALAMDGSFTSHSSRREQIQDYLLSEGEEET